MCILSRPLVPLSLCLSLCLSLFLSVCLSLCLSVYPSVSRYLPLLVFSLQVACFLLIPPVSLCDSIGYISLYHLQLMSLLCLCCFLSVSLSPTAVCLMPFVSSHGRQQERRSRKEAKGVGQQFLYTASCDSARRRLSFCLSISASSCLLVCFLQTFREPFLAVELAGGVGLRAFCIGEADNPQRKTTNDAEDDVVHEASKVHDGKMEDRRIQMGPEIHVNPNIQRENTIIKTTEIIRI